VIGCLFGFISGPLVAQSIDEPRETRIVELRPARQWTGKVPEIKWKVPKLDRQALIAPVGFDHNLPKNLKAGTPIDVTVVFTATKRIEGKFEMLAYLVDDAGKVLDLFQGPIASERWPIQRQYIEKNESVWCTASFIVPLGVQKPPILVRAALGRTNPTTGQPELFKPHVDVPLNR